MEWGTLEMCETVPSILRGMLRVFLKTHFKVCDRFYCLE